MTLPTGLAFWFKKRDPQDSSADWVDEVITSVQRRRRWLAEAKARIVQETTVTKAIASLIWVAGLFAWYTIRYPFEHRAKKLKVRKSLLDWRERVLLVIISFGLFAIPAAYVLTGFPASLNYAFIPAVAWIGLLALSGSLWLFRRSHVDLGRNWSMSLEVREQHVLVKTGIYRLIRHPMYGSFFF